MFHELFRENIFCLIFNAIFNVNMNIEKKFSAWVIFSNHCPKVLEVPRKSGAASYRAPLANLREI